ncbi:MAG: hypothetical protein H6851_02005 [Geminicoccaceae bacterium]|nr:hypothetical protein [Geminicoccaceae bacterium]MCB9942386.1 hypothetical protein [Geminicoccaceae bacterium]
MDIYHITCDLLPGVAAHDFASAVDAWLGHLRREGAIHGWRLTRRKLGLSSLDLGDFHIMIETRDLAQLDNAFAVAARNDQPAASLHAAVYGKVANLGFALYRDFPDRL